MKKDAFAGELIHRRFLLDVFGGCVSRITSVSFLSVNNCHSPFFRNLLSILRNFDTEISLN